MSDLTNLGEQFVRQFLFDSSLSICLLTAITDAEAGTVTELSTASTGYSPQDFDAAFATASGGGPQTNNAVVTFGPAVTAWALAGVGLKNGAGQWVAVKAFGSTQNVAIGNSFQFAVGSLTLSAD